MIEIIMEISLYLIVAIVLGFMFGWLIAKATKKEKYIKELEKFKALYIKDEKVKKRETYLKEENFIKNKNEIIDKLMGELSLEEEKTIMLKRAHEKEIEAFLFERTDITQKYKELLLKIEEIKKSQLL